MKNKNASIRKYLFRLILAVLIIFSFNSILFAKGTIGFGCGYAANRTKSIILIDSLVKYKDYNKIRKLLNANDNGVRCLAIIVCEILETKNVAKLTDKEKNIIKNAYQSDKKIHLCAGCTYSGKTTMKDILNEIDSDGWGFSNSIKQIVQNRYKNLIE